MSGLLILGAGGHGRVVAEAARLSGRWDDIAFLDDGLSAGDLVDGLPVLGGLADAPTLRGRFAEAVVAVGENRTRLRILGALRADDFSIPQVVHPDASVSGLATLGAGTVVFAQCAINPGARLGEGCIVNTGATVDHDCVLGGGVHLSPGVHLGGNVSIGECTWLGVGVSVKNGVVIGSDAVVGLGGAVVDDLPGGVIAVGVPATILRHS